MVSVGIDYGTKFSSVAILDSQGAVSLAVDALRGEATQTQSVVLFTPDGPLVGKCAETYANQASDLPQTPIKWTKQWLGSEQNFPDLEGNLWRVESVVALVLKKLSLDVERQVGSPITELTLTYPVGFPALDMYALRNAALLAGLPEPDLVEEPIAAAFHCAHDLKHADQYVVVYDFGAGTFDACVAKVGREHFEVLSFSGDHQLGGRNVDHELAKSIRNQLCFREFKYTDAQFALEEQCEQWKEALSGPNAKVIVKDMGQLHDQPKVIVSEYTVRDVATDIVGNTVDVATAALDRAKVKWEEIGTVFLVGGSSQLKTVWTTLRSASRLGADKFVSRDPLDAVARGAALAETKGKPLKQLLAVNDIGLLVWDTVVPNAVIERRFSRYQRLPAYCTVEFSPNDEGQRKFEIVLHLSQRYGQTLALAGVSFDVADKVGIDDVFEMRVEYGDDEKIRLALRRKGEEEWGQVKSVAMNEEHPEPDWFEEQRKLMVENSSPMKCFLNGKFVKFGE
ncbi:MAG: hypothetical protein PsegKO_33160 [Pseudohongiellaceae bacterium]